MSPLILLPFECEHCSEKFLAIAQNVWCEKCQKSHTLCPACHATHHAISLVCDHCDEIYRSDDWMQHTSCPKCGYIESLCPVCRFEHQLSASAQEHYFAKLEAEL